MENWRLEKTARDGIDGLINEIHLLEAEADNLKNEITVLTDSCDKKDERIFELEEELNELKTK